MGMRQDILAGAKEKCLVKIQHLGEVSVNAHFVMRISTKLADASLHFFPPSLWRRMRSSQLSP